MIIKITIGIKWWRNAEYVVIWRDKALMEEIHNLLLQLHRTSLAARIISNGGGGGGSSGGGQDSLLFLQTRGYPGGGSGGSGGGGGSTASPSATEPGGSTDSVTTPSPTGSVPGLDLLLKVLLVALDNMLLVVGLLVAVAVVLERRVNQNCVEFLVIPIPIVLALEMAGDGLAVLVT